MVKQHCVFAHQVEHLVSASLDVHSALAHRVEAVKGLASVDDVEFEQRRCRLRSHLSGGRFNKSELSDLGD